MMGCARIDLHPAGGPWACQTTVSTVGSPVIVAPWNSPIPIPACCCHMQVMHQSSETEGSLSGSSPEAMGYRPSHLFGDSMWFLLTLSTVDGARCATQTHTSTNESHDTYYMTLFHIITIGTVDQ